jgi:hypothetical protein
LASATYTSPLTCRIGPWTNTDALVALLPCRHRKNVQLLTAPIHTPETRTMATIDSSFLLPASAQLPSSKQKLFVRYFTAILIDLVVLGLFVEYSDLVVIDSFTIALFAALLLQALLKLTIALEHRVAAYFSAQHGGFAKFMRYFSAWLVLFGSKFVILEALAFAFGDNVYFGGPLHGLPILIAVIIVMLVAEEAIVQLYRRLA